MTPTSTSSHSSVAMRRGTTSTTNGLTSPFPALKSTPRSASSPATRAAAAGSSISPKRSKKRV